MGTDRRALTWKDLSLFIFIPAILAITGFLMRDLYAEVKTVRDTKVDKTEFYKVVESQDKKADIIIDMIRDHDRRSYRRNRAEGE